MFLRNLKLGRTHWTVTHTQINCQKLFKVPSRTSKGPYLFSSFSLFLHCCVHLIFLLLTFSLSIYKMFNPYELLGGEVCYIWCVSEMAMPLMSLYITHRSLRQRMSNEDYRCQSTLHQWTDTSLCG